MMCVCDVCVVVVYDVPMACHHIYPTACGYTTSPTHTPHPTSLTQVPLRIVTLRGSIPAQWTVDFQTLLPRNATLKVTQRNQLGDIFSQLNTRDKAVWGADAVTLGDVFMHAAIERRLIQPIDAFVDRRWWVCVVGSGGYVCVWCTL